jgi:DNA-binding beta-propeller fold protein YncE
VVSSENLFRTPKLQASAWIDRYPAAVPGPKVDRIATGHGFGRMAVDADSIWVANASSETVVRIDRREGRVGSHVELGQHPEAIAIGTEAVWVLGANGWLWRFRADGEGEGVARTGRGARDLVCDERSAWVLRANGDLLAVDQSTGEATVEAKVHRGGRQILRVGDDLVALSADGRRVCRIARDSGAVTAEARLPARGVRAVVHDNTIWVACARRLSGSWGALVPVDPASMTVGDLLMLPSAVRAITAGAGHLWVACGRRGARKSEIARLEPASGELVRWAETDWTVYDLALAGDELLVASGVSLAGPAAGLTDGGGMGGGHGGHHGGGGGH